MKKKTTIPNKPPSPAPGIPTIDELTAAVFADAAKFRIDEWRNGRLVASAETPNFHQAFLVCSKLVVDARQPLLYVVNRGGQTMLVPRSQWARYNELWESRKNVDFSK